MKAANVRRKRLEELLSLAQTYRGCNRKQLAQALGRDASNLVPDSGIPKMDLVVALARVLDWPVEEVVNSLWTNGPTTNGHGEVEDFRSLEQSSKENHREGRYNDAVELARRAYAAGSSGEDRALACNREAMGWDGLGRHTQALEACQRGLRARGVSTDRRMMLQVNLANAYYCLWHLVESGAMAQNLILRYESDPPANRLNRAVQAFAFYVRGHSHRRLLAIEPEETGRYARLARNDLSVSQRLYLELAEEFGDDSYRGIAHTCEGGILEADAALGQRDAGEVLERYTSELDALVDPEDYPVGDALESYGWWCIFGCNVALRHLTDQREMQRRMAVFTNKADEVAEQLGNWSIRERVFTMEYARRQRFTDWSGMESEWTIDTDDVRVITGTMGRFPVFHETGWRILRTAKVIRGN
ncbi:MAG: hypothetical protein ACYTG1_00555 [Planctomycetota bacterium]|jgi:hypothetical protein